MGTLANSEEPDEMTKNAAFHQAQHCLLRSIQYSGTEVYNYLEISTRYPLKYIMNNSISVWDFIH